MRRAFLVGVVLCLGAVVVPVTAASARAAHPASTRSAPKTSAPKTSAPTTSAPRAARTWPGRSALQREWARLAVGAPTAAPAAPVTGNATVTADPSTGLLDGQSVSVTASGLKAKTLYGIIECGTGATKVTGCAIDIGTLTFVTTDPTGSFSASDTVMRTITPQDTGTPVDCATAGACVLAVAAADGKIAADTPISFADVAIMLPTLAADPSTGLLDGQSITVSATDFPADASAAVVECPAGTPVGALEQDCDGSTVEIVEADATGAFSTSYRVTRVIQGSDGPVDCAGASACVLSTLNLADPTQAASTPIAFQDIAIVPPVLTVTPSTDLVDGQSVTISGKGFVAHQAYALSECAAGSANGSECVAEAGIGGDIAQVVAQGRSGRFSVPFEVARVLTLIDGTVDCAQAPGCVIGAIDEDNPAGSVDAVTPLAFNPKVKPLGPLNLTLHVDPTAQIVAGAHGRTGPAITGTISCARAKAVPVSFELQVAQPSGGLEGGVDVAGVATCRSAGSKFSVTVLTGKRDPAVPGIAGVLMAVSAVSGSASAIITVSTSITLKVPKG